MYNVVIFSGGTGSTALQEGFSAIYGNDNYNLDIIINAYDNGKSTGACRKVFDNKILGPSDLRKNHLHQFRIVNTSALSDPDSRESAIYSLFTLRISGKSKEDYYSRACFELNDRKDILGDELFTPLNKLLDYFFYENKKSRKLRKVLDDIDFTDFSLANIFYSSAAAKNGYSLRLAGKYMAQLLNIKDNVHLISDVNLYLKARTESGKIIDDEGEIVCWNDPSDKISSVFLTNDGAEYIPSIDEETDIKKVKSVKSLIEEADIIIFSSGTQWSSLIPTYMHSGFRDVLCASKASKYIVINNSQDYDMLGVSAEDMLHILDSYIPINDVTAVVNSDACDGMNKISSIRSIIGKIGLDAYKHDPIKTVSLIMKDYFGISDFDGTYFFDLDGALWDERADVTGKEVGAENVSDFSGIILSGNNYEHVRDVFKTFYNGKNVITIYSDFGNVCFNSSDYSKHKITDMFDIDPKIVDILNGIPYFRNKVKLRGEGCVITIKPLINRKTLVKTAQKVLDSFSDEYEARISGHTSIDIMKKNYNKKNMLDMIMTRDGLSANQVIFVGNETIKGSEAAIGELGVKMIQTNDVYECNVLLKTIRS